MCLIAWNWQPESACPLVLLSNRDEFYARPSLPLHWWDDAPILAGKDLQAGGTWLGVNRKGWLAALTNYRQAEQDTRPRPSRGSLVSGFLQGTTPPLAFAQAIAEEAHRYNPFNLLLFDGHSLIGLESRHRRLVTFQAGMGAVSNADFQTPWPKLMRLKEGLAQQGEVASTPEEVLLPLLHDQTPVEDSLLPRTGISLDKERMLSTAFIRSPLYGTRACSVVKILRSRVHFLEQNHTEHGMLSIAQQTFTT